MIWEFIKWIFSPMNLFENIFSLLSLILSGVISLAISHHFFRKDNRSNVESSLLFPIKRMLEKPYSETGYKEIKKLSESYCAKYLHAKERSCINELLSAYEAICNYDQDWARASGLADYFLDKLEQSGVNTKIEPVLDGDYNIIDHCVPQETCGLMTLDLYNAITDDHFYCEAATERERIIYVLSGHLATFLPDTVIAFFDDCSVNEAIENSPTKKEWDKKFEAMEVAKKKFLALKF